MKALLWFKKSSQTLSSKGGQYKQAYFHCHLFIINDKNTPRAHCFLFQV